MQRPEPGKPTESALVMSKPVMSAIFANSWGFFALTSDNLNFRHFPLDSLSFMPSCYQRCVQMMAPVGQSQGHLQGREGGDGGRGWRDGRTKIHNHTEGREAKASTRWKSGIIQEPHGRCDGWRRMSERVGGREMPENVSPASAFSSRAPLWKQSHSLGDIPFLQKWCLQHVKCPPSDPLPSLTSRHHHPCSLRTPSHRRRRFRSHSFLSQSSSQMDRTSFLSGYSLRMRTSHAVGL